jgi:anti-sigma B factor antagonist
MQELVEFKVSSVRVGPWAHKLRIDGELDLYTAPDVREELAGLSDEVRHVLVDLTQLSFMDSAGLATLVAGARRLRKRDGSMLLVVADPSVLRVLEVTGLDQYFEIRTDAENAAREFVALSAVAG